MQLVRDRYTPEEQWVRLRPEKEKLLTLTLQRTPGLKLPPSTSFPRLRAAIEDLGNEAADALREEAFHSFGALGDDEPVRPFRLDSVPATLPSIFSDMPQGQDVGPSLPPLVEPRADEQWYIVRRQTDAAGLRRRVFEERLVDDPATGRVATERIANDSEYAIRIDRKRLTAFVAGPNAGAAC